VPQVRREADLGFSGFLGIAHCHSVRVAGLKAQKKSQNLGLPLARPDSLMISAIGNF
jgi:hypothetical protein